MKLRKPLFSFIFCKIEFAPTLIPTLATMLLLPVLLMLGFWQIQRAEYKQSLQDSYQARANKAPVDLNKINDLKALKNNYQYYSVQATGFFDNKHQLLLDNKFYQHQVGYQVLTPLVLADGKTAVLVNRGWIAQGRDRMQLPTIASVAQEVTIQGITNTAKTGAFVLGQTAEKNSWPQVVQEIDIEKLATITGYKFFPFVVLLNADQANGYVRNWSPANLKPSVSYGYAFQWFSLALALLIIYIVVNLQKQKQVGDNQ